MGTSQATIQCFFLTLFTITSHATHTMEGKESTQGLPREIVYVSYKNINKATLAYLLDGEDIFGIPRWVYKIVGTVIIVGGMYLSYQHYSSYQARRKRRNWKQNVEATITARTETTQTLVTGLESESEQHATLIEATLALQKQQLERNRTLFEDIQSYENNNQEILASQHKTLVDKIVQNGDLIQKIQELVQIGTTLQKKVNSVLEQDTTLEELLCTDPMYKGYLKTFQQFKLNNEVQLTNLETILSTCNAPLTELTRLNDDTARFIGTLHSPTPSIIYQEHEH